jgi:hypothetical protein
MSGVDDAEEMRTRTELLAYFHRVEQMLADPELAEDEEQK